MTGFRIPTTPNPWPSLDNGVRSVARTLEDLAKLLRVELDIRPGVDLFADGSGSDGLSEPATILVVVPAEACDPDRFSTLRVTSRDKILTRVPAWVVVVVVLAPVAEVDAVFSVFRLSGVPALAARWPTVGGDFWGVDPATPPDHARCRSSRKDPT